MLVDEYRKQQAELTRKLWQEGKYNFLRQPLEDRKCSNPDCAVIFQVKPYDPKKYCSRACAATVNNRVFVKRSVLKNCQNCNKKLNSSAKKYCNSLCQSLYQYSDYIKRWKLGLVSGNNGITTRILSPHIKRYLREKYGEKCSVCGWGEKHPLTGKVPVEVDHVDGNADNNREENLRLICPNCHSLTPSFRNLNKGKGRSWRLTYIASHKVVSGRGGSDWSD